MSAQLTYQRYSGAEGAQIALDHHLYQSGWLLMGYLRQLLGLGPVEGFNCTVTGELVIAYLNGRPVGVAAKLEEVWLIGHSRKFMMVFVQPAYRRLGIGSGCLAVFAQDEDYHEHHANPGIRGSGQFFTRNKITVQERGYIPVSSDDLVALRDYLRQQDYH